MKFKKEEIAVYDPNNTEERICFKMQINIHKDGYFIAVLPTNILELLLSYGLIEKGSEINNSKYDTLVSNVKSLCRETYERELISTKTVITYAVESACSYQKNDIGEIFPNGTYETNGNWLSGSINQNAAQPSPYSIEVFVRLYEQREYKYKSGKIFIENKPIFGNKDEKDETKNWLSNLTGICANSNSRLQTIDYTPELGAYFVSLIKGICLLNEKLSIFRQPEKLIESSINNILLLS